MRSVPRCGTVGLRVCPALACLSCPACRQCVDARARGGLATATCPLASTSVAQSFDSFVEAAGQFFSDLAAVHWGALALGLIFFGLEPHAALARVLPQPARRLSRGELPVAAHLGRIRRGGGLQQRRARPRGGHHQAVPHTQLDPRLLLPHGRRRLLRGGRLRRVRRRVRAHLRLLPGRLSQAARLLKAQLLRHLLPGLPLPLHALSDHPARRPRVGRLRAALGSGEGVLGACTPGAHDPHRPPSLSARSSRVAGGRVGVPLPRLLVPARRLPRGGLGRERPAGVRRRSGRGRRPVHPRAAPGCSRRCS